MFTYKKIIKTSRVLILLVFFFNTKAQINLIPNPSFENFSTSLTNCNTYTMLTNWYEVFSAGWILSTDNAFNCLNCSDSAPLSTAGYKFPRNGNTYCGLTLRSLLPVNGYQNFSNGFNLIGVKLVNQLKLDHAYNFNLYYILSQCSNKTNNQLSVYLTKNQFLINSYGFNPLSQIWYNNNINYINPQINFDSSQYLNADTSNWQNFTGCFISNGTENYLTIGNFRDGKYNKLQDVNSNWNRPCSLSQFQGTAIFIDDLSLYDVGLYAGNAKCSNDTLLCALGSSLSIGNNIKDSAVYAWYPPTGLSCTNCPNPVASPTQSIKYVVSKSLCNIVSKDSIFISFFTPNLPLSAGNNATLCAGQSANIGASAMPYYNYNWQPAQAINCSTCALAIVNPSTATTYTLSRSLCNEIKSATVSISLKPNYTTAPNISLSNSVACLWDTLQFSCKTLPTTAFNYTWQPYGQYLQSNNNMAKALIANNNFYYFQISNQNTEDNTYCPYTLKDSVFITLPDTCKKPIFILPQVLTPNGDGFNDQLEIQLPNTKNATLQVFNRWGNLVYGTSNSSPVLQNGYSVLILKWDGTCNSNSLVLGGSGGKLPAGTYFYLVESTEIKGNTHNYKQFVVLVY